MNIKYFTVITILFLCCVFGFEENSYSLNKVSQDDISELKILKFLPKDNKTFFISNTKSSKITNAVRTNFETKNQDELVLVKNSILAYLGVDLGTNKLEDIYNSEDLMNKLSITYSYYIDEGLKIDITWKGKQKNIKAKDILYLKNLKSLYPNFKGYITLENNKEINLYEVYKITIYSDGETYIPEIHQG